MYDNIGRKIQILAKVSGIVIVVASVVIGFAVVSLASYYRLYGILCMTVVPVLSLISSWLLYGYGELIEKVSDIEYNTRDNKTK